MNLKQLLSLPISDIPKVTGSLAKLIASQLKLNTWNDLLYFFPYRYQDKTQVYSIKDLYQQVDNEVQIIATIRGLEEIPGKKFKRLVLTLKDETGYMQAVWFQYPAWMLTKLKLNSTYLFFGKVNQFNQILSMVHPEFEEFQPHKVLPKGFFPVYSSTELLQRKGISHKWFQQKIDFILQNIQPHLTENLSNTLIHQNKLISRDLALRWIHFPPDGESLKQAKRRLKFEEIFFFQLSFGIKKYQEKIRNRSYPIQKIGTYFETFYHQHLPFELTSAQKKVLKEIREDLRKNEQMHRLLQGDVGSGKTMVAFLTCLMVIDNGYQTCIMAPTEVLAKQHHQSIRYYAEKLGLKVHLLTGSTKTSERKIILSETQNGETHILIGTHALLEDVVTFKQLALSIIDEQHRFGVAQREKLWRKSFPPPHILIMTATPIPRTLAMSYYSDLDLSVIDELPGNRLPIKTIHQTETQRFKVYNFIEQEILKGRQIFIVYPLIEESQALDFEDLMNGFEVISRRFPLPHYQVGLVHGRMTAQEKDLEMKKFEQGKTNILIATTVIEVGINIPNATVMVIENAERYGLAQLHQLRGRVGRGEHQSYCILLTKDQLSKDAQKRIDTLCETNDGFRIAEVDLELRGAGDLLGTQQSGLMNFKILRLEEDHQVVQHAKKQVDELLKNDPNLQKHENLPIRKHFEDFCKDRIKWGNIG